MVGWTLHRQHQQTRQLGEQQATFLRLLAHELKTPLTNLELYTELARGSRDLAELLPYLDIFESEFSRLRRLVNNAVHQQGEARHRLFNPQTVELQPCLLRLLAPFQPRLQASHTALSLDCQCPPQLRLPTVLLECVISNLVDNLVQHAHGQPAQLSCRWTDDQLVISLADNGPGLPAGFRLHPPTAGQQYETTRSQEGLRLGLRVVDRILQQVGGTLQLHPQPGGLRAEARLPATLPDAIQPEPARAYSDC